MVFIGKHFIDVDYIQCFHIPVGYRPDNSRGYRINAERCCFLNGSVRLYFYFRLANSFQSEGLFGIFMEKEAQLNHFYASCKKGGDDRFTPEQAKQKYETIYQKIETNKGCDETQMWYEIYNRHRDEPIVFGSNRDYLLLRDLHSQTRTLFIVYALLVWVTEIISFSREYVLYLAIMVVALNIGARVQGKRMVYTVLSVDLNQPVKKEATKND